MWQRWVWERSCMWERCVCVCVKDSVWQNCLWQSLIWERWTHSQRACPQVPSKGNVDVTKCHACHAKCRARATNGAQARHQGQPSVISATPATQNEGWYKQAPRLPRKTKVEWKNCVWKSVWKRVCDKVVSVCEQVVCDKFVCHSVWKRVCDNVVCDKAMCEQVVCDNVVCERECDKVVCDKRRRRRSEEEAAEEEEERDTASKTRTPHTKMWGKKQLLPGGASYGLIWCCAIGAPYALPTLQSHRPSLPGPVGWIPAAKALEPRAQVQLKCLEVLALHSNHFMI